MADGAARPFPPRPQRRHGFSMRTQNAAFLARIWRVCVRRVNSSNTAGRNRSRYRGLGCHRSARMFRQFADLTNPTAWPLPRGCARDVIVAGRGGPSCCSPSASGVFLSQGLLVALVAATLSARAEERQGRSRAPCEGETVIFRRS